MSRHLSPSLLLLTLCACAASPGDPDALEVVAARPAEEAPAPRRLRGVLSSRVEGEAPLQLWLPLPAAGLEQRVESLVVEVPPPGVYELLEPTPGERVLHVSGPPPSLVAGWRAVVAQPPAAAEPLPEPLRALPPGLSAPDWVEAARQAHAEARLTRGLVAAAEPPAADQREWPELLRGEAWRAVDPATGSLLPALPGLRLGSTPPRATTGAAEATPSLTVELSDLE